MSKKAFLLFHLNLSFSSIGIQSRRKVIKNCYWPLLNLANKNNIKIMLEFSGKTLEEIYNLDKIFIQSIKKLIIEKKIEIIGSGYCQIIGPIVPYKVNLMNQIIGKNVYKKILNYTPKIALVNEMAFSSGTVDFYLEAGYKAIIMDRDNVALSLRFKNKNKVNAITHALGTNKKGILVIWTDSIFFQKFQRYCHNELSIDEYMNEMQNQIRNYVGAIPIYANDAEIFNFRPGRFKEEPELKKLNEWQRISKLTTALQDRLKIEFVSLDSLITKKNCRNKYKAQRINSTSMPVPVKKQPKYNISRWAVTGRDDFTMNTSCHKIYNHFKKNKIIKNDKWKELLNFWSSDFRTHIEEKRWKKIKKDMNSYLVKNKILNDTINKNTNKKYFIKEYNNKIIPCLGYNLNKKNGKLEISNNKFSMYLNCNKGLTLDNLKFMRHKNDKELIGSLPHGFLNSIEYGADFYSASILIESISERKRYTDLRKVKEQIFTKDNELYISCTIPFVNGKLIKTYVLKKGSDKVKIMYDLKNWEVKNSIIRLGNFIIKNPIRNQIMSIVTNTGGKKDEHFAINKYFDHSAPVSALVSATTGLPSNEGKIRFLCGNNSLNFTWDPSASAVMPMIKNMKTNPIDFTRLIFSISEVDDTFKDKQLNCNFSINLFP